MTITATTETTRIHTMARRVRDGELANFSPGFPPGMRPEFIASDKEIASDYICLACREQDCELIAYHSPEGEYRAYIRCRACRHTEEL